MSGLRSYAVGETNRLIVGVEGVVEAITEDTLTIAGHTLPKRLGSGVRYLSMVWPESEIDCERDHCGPECDVAEPIDIDEDLRADHEALLEVLEVWHHDHHSPGAFRFCTHPVCREANR